MSTHPPTPSAHHHPDAARRGWRARWGTGPAGWRPGSLFVVVLVAFVIGAEFAWVAFGASSIGPVLYLPAGVTTATMLLVERRRWPVVLAAAALGEAMVDLHHGVALGLAAGYTLANTVEPLVGAAACRRLARGVPRLDRHRGLRDFLIGAVLIGPLVGGVIGALVKRVESDAPFPSSLLSWWLGDGIGVLSLGAALLAISEGLWSGPAKSKLETALVPASTALLTAAAFWYTEVPPALIATPMLVYAALRFGTPGVGIATAALATITNVATAAEHGLFGAMDVPGTERIRLAQLFILSLAITGWFLAIETTERHDHGIARVREQEARARAEAMQTVTALGAELSRLAGVEEIVEAFDALVHEHFGAPHTVVARHDAERGAFEVMPRGRHTAIDRLFQHLTTESVAPGPLAMRTGRPVWVDNRAHLVARFPDSATAQVASRIQVLGAIALVGPDGPWGFVIAARSEDRPFDEMEREGLQALAHVVGQALGRAELLEETQRRAALEHLRRRLGDTAAHAPSRLALKAGVSRLLGEHLGAMRVHWVDVDADGGFGAVRVGYHPGVQSMVGYHLLDEHGLQLMQSVRAGVSVYVDDVGSDDRLTADERPVLASLGVHAFALEPVMTAGITVGLLVVHFGSAHRWTATERSAVSDAAARLWSGLVELRNHASDEIRRHRASALAELTDRMTDTAGETPLQTLVDVLTPRLADMAMVVTDDGSVVASSSLSNDLARRLTVRGGLRPGPIADVVKATAAGEPTLVSIVPPNGHALPPLRSVAAVPLQLDDAVLVAGTTHRDRDPFTPDDLAYLERLVDRFDRHRHEERRRRIDHEVAVTLQRALLPSDVVVRPSLAVEARYLAAAEMVEVGGDWYDTFEWPDGSVGLMVGDVVGHDLRSAAAMGRLRAAASALAASVGPDPAALLDGLDSFCTGKETIGFATAVCVVIHPTTGDVVHSSAGHPPGITVAPDGTIGRLEGAGSPPLGGFAEGPRRNAHTVLQPGATVLLYSDGLVERPREVLDDGFARLEATAVALIDRPLERFTDEVLAAMSEPSASNDDVVLLCARHLPVLDTLRVELPPRQQALLGMRATVRNWLRSRGLVDAAFQYDLQLALSEACSNSVEHAYRAQAPRPITVTVEDRGERITAEVADSGSWRPQGGHSAGRGRGLPILRSVTSVLAFEQRDDGTALRFTIAAPQRAPLQVQAAAPPA